MPTKIQTNKEARRTKTQEERRDQIKCTSTSLSLAFFPIDWHLQFSPSIYFYYSFQKMIPDVRSIYASILVVLILLSTSLGDKEELPKEKQHHGRETFEQKHHGSADGKHNVEMDHKAVLGSEKAVHEFDDLPPEESKKRLRVLAKKMDADKDGFISMEELTEWVRNSLMTLDQEETRERFDELDENKDGIITWAEYIQEAFGVSDGDEAEKLLTDPDDLKLFEEDRRYFAAADLDSDMKLSKEEFNAFQNPEHAQHMHQTLIENTLIEKDANKDGKIDLGEFMGDLSHEQPQSEWYLTEKTRFKQEYDKNGDGFLEGEELRTWLIPDLSQTARQEAQHLVESADADKDGQLTLDEVVDAYKTFVGSEATNYGEHLLNVRHDEL